MFVFFGKIHNNQVIIFFVLENHSTLINIKFCHTSNLPELCIYTKDTTAEMALKSAQYTQKRNKFGHFRSFYLGKLTWSKASIPYIYMRPLYQLWDKNEIIFIIYIYMLITSEETLFFNKQLNVPGIAWRCLWCKKDIVKIRRVTVPAKIDFLHPKTTSWKYSFIRRRTNV